MKNSYGKQLDQIKRDAEEWVNRHPYGFKDKELAKRHYIKAALREAARH